MKDPAPLQHVSFPHNTGLDGMYKRIHSEVFDMSDKALYDGIVRMCNRLGVTDLYLMDEQFVLEALKEKFEREYGRKLNIDENRGMTE